MVLVPANMFRFGLSPCKNFVVVIGPCKYVLFWSWAPHLWWFAHV